MAIFEKQGELDALRRERKNIRDKLEDLDELIKKINAEEDRLSEGLDTTLANVRAKLDRLPPNSLLRETHYSNIRRILRGSESNNLFQEADDGLDNAKRKKRELENRQREVDRRIAALEAEAMEADEDG